MEVEEEVVGLVLLPGKDENDAIKSDDPPTADNKSCCELDLLAFDRKFCLELELPKPILCLTKALEEPLLFVDADSCSFLSSSSFAILRTVGCCLVVDLTLVEEADGAIKSEDSPAADKRSL